MKGELCEKAEAQPSTSLARRQAIPVAAILRERGVFPPALDARGRSVDLSPLAGLSARERRKRLVGILELLACHGDGPAAAEALRHARWEEEMRKGKAPSRDTLSVSGDIRVIDDLRSPGDTPIPIRARLRPA